MKKTEYRTITSPDKQKKQINELIEAVKSRLSTNILGLFFSSKQKLNDTDRGFINKLLALSTYEGETHNPEKKLELICVAIYKHCFENYYGAHSRLEEKITLQLGIGRKSWGKYLDYRWNLHADLINGEKTTKNQQHPIEKYIKEFGLSTFADGINQERDLSSFFEEINPTSQAPTFEKK